jgi:hypothetical protein
MQLVFSPSSDQASSVYQPTDSSMWNVVDPSAHPSATLMGLVRMGDSAMGSALYTWEGSDVSAGPARGHTLSLKLVACNTACVAGRGCKSKRGVVILNNSIQFNSILQLPFTRE